MKTYLTTVAVLGTVLAASACTTDGAAASGPLPTSSTATTATGPAPSSPAPTGPAVWPAAGAPAPAVPTIAWKRCADSKVPGLQCATVKVPLSYREPQGAQILLDVAKLPATGKGARQGSVFVNPGGPGESAIGHIERFKEVLGTQVTSAFDIIAMDPRGVGASSQARCWSNDPEPEILDTAPLGAKERTTWAAHDAYENAACATSGRPIIGHVSTANVARDMDLVRQAVGDPRLTYYGVSYGTFLGATYAQLFPGTVRAMVLDGVVDPVAWTTGIDGNGATVPVSVRTGSPEAALDNLNATIAACEKAGAARCPHAATIRSEWQQTVAALSKGPVEVDGVRTGLASFTYSLETLQYDPADASSVLGLVHDTYLAVVKKQKDLPAAPPPPNHKFAWPADDGAIPSPGATAPGAGAAETASAPKPGRTPAPGTVVNPTQPQPDSASWWDTFTHQAPMCADAVNPTDPQAWGRYADTPAARSNPYTESWLWQSSLCARWPGQDEDAYRGPFDAQTAAPILVVGNTHDNATPLSSARSTAERFPGARLLTVDAFGHTASDKSTCASKAMRDYLTQGTLPAEGTTCAADKPLF